MVVLVNLHVILYYYPYCGWMESCVSLSFSLTTTLALPISPLVSEYALYFDFVAILMWRTARMLSVVIDLAFIQRTNRSNECSVNFGQIQCCDGSQDHVFAFYAELWQFRTILF